MSLEDQIASKFVCSKCDNHQASVKRLAVSGTGLSKILDIQHNQLIAVSCRNCGYTEMFNPEVLEGKRQLGNVLDVIFGS